MHIMSGFVQKKRFFKRKTMVVPEILCSFARQIYNKFHLQPKIFKVMSEVADKVKAIIVDKLGVDESEVTPQASFTNDLGADSLDTVELIMEFEKAFGITIPDDQAEKISTVGEAIAHIEAALK
ncbi:acyl carrier protein [Microbacter margulisiae]|uniref:Acyl carrier protein n=2 Tax=Microbacter margulisiae TaxID=1350067 RepID=A0A7W5DQR6_9PORP|nr:acyl carrier protein [Microbacter margulisiae]